MSEVERAEGKDDAYHIVTRPVRIACLTLVCIRPAI
jgi:hypothetical protein